MAVERVASEGMGLERVAPERVDRNRKRKREKTCIFKNNNNKNNNNNSNNSRPPKMSHLACLHVSYIQNTKHILLFPHRRLFVDRVPLIASEASPRHSTEYINASLIKAYLHHKTISPYPHSDIGPSLRACVGPTFCHSTYSNHAPPTQHHANSCRI